ncbi:MAG: 4a-hydroxytetrahydrobiopterin dehydratase [Candidatus Omnitrophica bacterium]|nr:putative pterin-4-alpha-carbinolamine dehydratase [bacterium]NUN95541.1 4a-hydroxytetrahydrobiopterin dehydratase [Candidatus Omnitrophota bacterium]
MSHLAQRECVPCKAGTPPLESPRIAELLGELGNEWKVVEEHHLEKEYKFPNFLQALAFVNRVGGLAEAVGHHPDVYLAWGKVRLTLWTHSVNGLTESDFVFAAKADAVL